MGTESPTDHRQVFFFPLPSLLVTRPNPKTTYTEHQNKKSLPFDISLVLCGCEASLVASILCFSLVFSHHLTSPPPPHTQVNPPAFHTNPHPQTHRHSSSDNGKVRGGYSRCPWRHGDVHSGGDSVRAGRREEEGEGGPGGREDKALPRALPAHYTN